MAYRAVHQQLRRYTACVDPRCTISPSRLLHKPVLSQVEGGGQDNVCLAERQWLSRASKAMVLLLQMGLTGISNTRADARAVNRAAICQCIKLL